MSARSQSNRLRSLAFRVGARALAAWSLAGLTGCATDFAGWKPMLWPSGPEAVSVPATAPLSQDAHSVGPKKPTSLYAEAHSRDQAGELPEAVAAYERVLKADPNHAGAHRRLALAAVRLGRPELAREHFRRALELEPRNAELLTDAGQFFYLQNDLVEAEALVRRAASLQPDSKRAQNVLGLCQARSGRSADALASFKRAGLSAAEADSSIAFATMGQMQSDSPQRPSNRSPVEQALVRTATPPLPKSMEPSRAVGPVVGSASAFVTTPTRTEPSRPLPTRPESSTTVAMPPSPASMTHSMSAIPSTTQPVSAEVWQPPTRASLPAPQQPESQQPAPPRPMTALPTTVEPGVVGPNGYSRWQAPTASAEKSSADENAFPVNR